MSELISRDALLGVARRRFATVAIEQFGNVRIRSLTEGERSRLEASMRDKHGNLNNAKATDLKCRLIVECVVDEQGNQLYSTKDIDQIRQQDCKITNAIAEAIMAHCGFSKDDIEDLEKNCEAMAAAG